MRNQLIAVLAALCTSGAFAHEEDAGKGQLGKVNFANSCSPKVQQKVSRAVAMLHSFWWPAGQASFQEIAAEDPNCVVAAWGFASILMYNPFAGGSTPPADVARAQGAIEKGRQMNSASQREKDYLEAVAAYWQDYASRTEREMWAEENDQPLPLHDEPPFKRELPRAPL